MKNKMEEMEELDMKDLDMDLNDLESFIEEIEEEKLEEVGEKKKPRSISKEEESLENADENTNEVEDVKNNGEGEKKRPWASIADFATIMNSMNGKVRFFFNDDNLMVEFTPVIKPIPANEIKKGQAIYDYNKKKYFSISLSESIMIDYYLNKLEKDEPLPSIKENNIEIKEVKFKDEKKYKAVKITHFPKGNPTSIEILPLEGKGVILTYRGNNDVVRVTTNYQNYRLLKTIFEMHKIYKVLKLL